MQMEQMSRLVLLLCVLSSIMESSWAFPFCWTFQSISRPLPASQQQCSPRLRSPVGRVGALRMDTEGWNRPTIRGAQDVVIGAQAVSKALVSSTYDADCTLSAYMALPIDQFTKIRFPSNTRLEAIDAEHFALRVPALTMFNIGLLPVITAKVSKTEDGVVIEAQESKIEQLGQLAFAKGFDINAMSSSAIKVVLKRREGLRRQFEARTEIKVWVDPPPLMRAMIPPRLLSETGTAVLQASLNLVQGSILRGLADDYNRWAADHEYRSACRKAYQH